MGIQAYNANIMNIMEAKTLGKPLYGIFFGAELEFEINPKAKIVLDYVETVPLIKRKSLFDEGGSHQNTPLANFICDALYPSIKEFCIIKRDGSLDNGLEIVSVPMSRDSHNNRWNEFFENLDKYGLMVRASCGMHVHVSRDWLTNLQIGKMLHFIHSPKNEAFLKLMAGRKPPEEHANVSAPMKVTDIKVQSNREVKLRKRYDGFNITGAATVEFRFFKGTNSLDRFLTNIDFCASLIDFSWPGVCGLGKNNLEGYLEFVSDRKRRKEYPYLARFLVSKELIEGNPDCPRKFKNHSFKNNTKNEKPKFAAH